MAQVNNSELRDEYFSILEENETELRKEITEFVRAAGQSKNLTRLVDGHVLGRARFFFNSIFPWIETYLDLETAVAAEFGPGSGSTTVPLALKCKKVHAFDISPSSTNVLRTRASFFKDIDLELHVQDHLENLNKLSEIAPVDLVLMFAVLEHMTLEERLEALTAAWSALSEGGILVIGDTPNRLVYQHKHTSHMPFFDMLPTRLIREYTEQMPNAAFADSLSKWMAEGQTDEMINAKIDRWGRGVSFHELDIAIGSLSDVVASDGLAPNLLKAMPIQPSEPLLMRFLAQEVPTVPLGFARASLYLILQKGGRRNAQAYPAETVKILLGSVC